MNASAKFRVFLKLLLGALLTLVFSGDAQGDLETLWRCREKFSSLDRRIPLVDLSAPAQRSGRFAGAEAILAKQKRDLNPEQYDAFEKWYFDHFFSDRWEAFADSADAAAVALQHASRYAKDGEDPMEGYRTARGYLWQIPLENMTPENVFRAQDHLLSWRSTPDGKNKWFGWTKAANSEKTKNEDLGRVRERSVTFVVQGAKEATNLKSLHDINPYLFYRESPTVYESDAVYYMPMSEWRKFASHLSPELQKKLIRIEETEHALTEATLPAAKEEARAKLAKEEDLERWELEIRDTKLLKDKKISKQEFEDRLGKNERVLWEKFQKLASNESFKLDRKRRVLDSSDSPDISILRVEFMNEMLAHRWQELHQDLARARTEGAIVAAIASFHYDFISMHPFINGNGRTGRLLSERLLAEFGLPPPIWAKFGEDVALKKSEFTKEFVHALAISKEFHRDLAAVVDNKIPHGTVGLGFLAPVVTRDIAARHPGVDASEFLTWVAAGRSHYLNIEASLTAYQAWRTRADQKQVHLATPIFVGGFGKPSPNETIYLQKLLTDYSPEMVYRTIRDRAELSDATLLGHFSEMEPGVELGRSMNDFNRVILRDMSETTPWLNRSWLGTDAAKKAGMVRLYKSPSQAEDKPEGKGRVKYQIEALLRKPGTLTSEAIVAAGYETKGKQPGVVFHAAGVDPEAIQKVTAVSGKNRIAVAEREASNRVRIEDFEAGERTATRTYELSSDGTWFQTGLSR